MNEPHRRVNVRGKSITTFIAFEAARALAELESGEVLELVADSNDAIRGDLSAWCRATGHHLDDVVTEDGVDRLLIRKAAEARAGGKMAFVVSDAGLEELLSPLGFALAGALEGSDVHLYFQGPAVRVLGSRFTPHLKGWWRRAFSPFARRGMEKAGHIHPHAKLRQLKELGAHLYACYPSMQRFKVSRDDLLFPDVEVVEYLTFIDVMAEADVQIYP